MSTEAAGERRKHQAGEPKPEGLLASPRFTTEKPGGFGVFQWLYVVLMVCFYGFPLVLWFMWFPELSQPLFSRLQSFLLEELPTPCELH